MRILILLVLFSFILPNNQPLAEGTPIKAAFIRDGNLWTLLQNEEKQITSSGTIYSEPQWSPDGEWIVYQREGTSEFSEAGQQIEVWAYHVESEENIQLFYDGHSPTWSPANKTVAFNAQGILNISDLKKFYNIATGVNSYTWLPDGSGFLLSSAGVLRPDGWTSATLYKKKVSGNYQDIVLFGGVEHFFTLPREIGVNDTTIIAVYANNLHYSPSKEWISFIVSPTASWSMDSNMLCVISSEGNTFEVLDEVILGVGLPKWAPSSDTLAYIAGGGRIVFGFKNKDLKVKEMPATGSFTPPNFADLDFDWITNHSIIVSRVEEKEWSNDFTKHPLPTLYLINTNTNKQTQLTSASKKYGDYQPKFVKGMNQIVWFRGESLTDSEKDLWKANIDGSDAKEWIKNVEAIKFDQSL